MPLVSVIMPAFNAERYIAEAVCSVLGQSHRDLELIVIDDGSTDGTARILASFDDSRVRVLRTNQNRGPGAARNLALGSAKGPVCALLDADDRWLTHHLRTMVAALLARADLVVVSGGCRLIDDLGREVGLRTQPYSPAAARWCLLWRNPVIASSAVFRTAAALDAGLMDEGLRYGEDADLWARMCASGDIDVLGTATIEYRVHFGGMTQALASDRKASWERQVYQRNTERLAGVSCTPEAIGLLRGDSAAWTDEIANEAARTLEACAMSMLPPGSHDGTEQRHQWLSCVLRDALALCRREPRLRPQLATLARRLPGHLGWDVNVSLQVAEFLARIHAPAGVRAMARLVTTAWRRST